MQEKRSFARQNHTEQTRIGRRTSRRRSSLHGGHDRTMRRHARSTSVRAFRRRRVRPRRAIAARQNFFGIFRGKNSG